MLDRVLKEHIFPYIIGKVWQPEVLSNTFHVAPKLITSGNLLNRRIHCMHSQHLIVVTSTIHITACTHYSESVRSQSDLIVFIIVVAPQPTKWPRGKMRAIVPTELMLTLNAQKNFNRAYISMTSSRALETTSFVSYITCGLQIFNGNPVERGKQRCSCTILH